MAVHSKSDEALEKQRSRISIDIFLARSAHRFGRWKAPPLRLGVCGGTRCRSRVTCCKTSTTLIKTSSTKSRLVNSASRLAYRNLYVNRPGILPTIVENCLPHDLAGLRSILRFDRAGIDSHVLVLAWGNEERSAIGDTNASSRASFLNMFGIGARWKLDPHIDAVRTGPARTPTRRYDLIRGGACTLPTKTLDWRRKVLKSSARNDR